VPSLAPEDVARSPHWHRRTAHPANPALPDLPAADPQGRTEVPLLRHLARMGRPLVGLGAMAPSSLPTVDPMHSTQIAKPFHRAGWIYEEKVDGWRWWRPRPVARCDSSAGMAAMVEFEPDDRASFPSFVGWATCTASVAFRGPQRYWTTTTAQSREYPRHTGASSTPEDRTVVRKWQDTAAVCRTRQGCSSPKR